MTTTRATDSPGIQEPADTQESGTGQQAQDKAREVAGQAQERAQEAAGQAKDRIREQVDQRSTQAGEQVSGAAGDVRNVADELRKQGRDGPARYAERAADQAERLGGYLTKSDGDTILRDAEDFGRRRPWAVVAGAFAIGFAASRLLKASSSERYRSSQTQPRPLPQATTGVSPQPDTRY
jgi:ElaB/YqjD/DUF883 family membrane-anchored ribosome-binding protein